MMLMINPREIESQMWNWKTTENLENGQSHRSEFSFLRQLEIDFLSPVPERIFSRPNQKFANVGCYRANRTQVTRRKTAVRRRRKKIDIFWNFTDLWWIGTWYKTLQRTQIVELDELLMLLMSWTFLIDLSQFKTLSIMIVSVSPPQANFFWTHSCTLYSKVRFSIFFRASEFFPST